MNEKCYDSGTIQAFLDGELTPESSLKFTNHIGVCDACAAALAEAEEETAFVFAALDTEMNALVPTQRLWTKINETIAEEKRQTPFWQKIWSFISVSMANPSLTVAAGIFVALGLFTAVLVLRPEQANDVARVNPPQILTPALNPIEVTAPVTKVENPKVSNLPTTVAKKERGESRRESEIRRMIVKTDFRAPVSPNSEPDIKTPPTQKAVYLPGEDSYVKTIATLKETIDSQKDNVLRPSQRVAFERDLAVVEDSIKKMRREVQKNPKNESAKQILYTAYQNKIDLLNSVAGRNELMASLK